MTKMQKETNIDWLGLSLRFQIIPFTTYTFTWLTDQ